MNDLRDDSLALVKEIEKGLSSKKGKDIVVLDIRGLSSVADFFVLCSGTSTRHVEALGEELSVYMKKMGAPARAMEGKGTGQWVLLDFVDVIVHIFHHEARSFYDLENLWSEAPKLEV